MRNFADLFWVLHPKKGHTFSGAPEGSATGSDPPQSAGQADALGSEQRQSGRELKLRYVAMVMKSRDLARRKSEVVARCS